MTTEPVADALTRVEHVIKQVPGLVLEVLNDADYQQQAATLRALGRLLGELSATALARAAEMDKLLVEPVQRVIIDAQGLVTTATMNVIWGRSAHDGRLHAWTSERWCSDAIALCQHTCPAQRVDCAGHGDRCQHCADAAGSP